jgi:pantoate--beta-alanine ligase
MIDDNMNNTQKENQFPSRKPKPQVITTIAQMRAVRKSIPGRWGFVPTMGYLHEGHMSLVRQARQENDVVAVSIFVNPTQFGPKEDFSRYPRDPERDLSLLSKEGADYVFAPSTEEMYPAGYLTYVEVEKVTDLLEGASRPGHFRGVATVVAKLFNIVQADKAYFGQKDAQQVVVLQRMTADLNLPVEIVVAPIVREADGLAMSSRNVYLSPEERAAAPVLHRALEKARMQWAGGQKSVKALKQTVEATVATEALVKLEYVSIADAGSLEELDNLEGKPALLSLAARLGRTRLIDNELLIKNK